MSDFFRRASDALQHRQRQGSADSTDAPKSPDAANHPEPDMIKQQAGTNQPESRVPEASAGGAAASDAHPKHRYWVWGHRQENKPLETQQSNQGRKDDTDWVIGS
ncbi:uncharacterized protein N7496_000175 [Penicillium cataractarum]|uniref:Uncharacterized protein n=1 Tax=Penicillium cataractarum TaxID=2100454 RepID=A0A9X0B5U4_9EURO|nr:uncharacterized protein N7496_000175 [Penicillium cataractarum]KAJ5389107.1 hypothetical protein N7496_000175 [Penicillium cataractarum]